MSDHPDGNNAALSRAGRYPISASVISGLVLVADSAVTLGTGALLYSQMINVNADTLGIYSTVICAIWISMILLFQFSELYRFEAIVRPIANLDKIIISFATAFMFLLAAAFALKITESFSRLWVVGFAVGACGLTVLYRLLFSVAVLSLSRRGFFSRNLIIVGKQTHVPRLLERLERMRSDVVTVSALFIDGASDSIASDLPILGTSKDVPAFIRTERVDDVVIAMPWSSEKRILSLVDELRELPVNVYLGSDLIGLRLDFREPPGHFNNAPIFSVVGRPLSGWSVAIKAIEDRVLAALILLLAALPMVLIALLVKVSSPGPVFFKQKRLGFNNKVFWIYKFRSMRHAEKPETKTVQATREDPRVTAVGRFLRRSSLDELPQLFNVLNGTMSLVGPRPHAVDHNEEYSRKIRGYFSRHRVKPGITGWAQVNGLRGETDTPEKMEARVRYDVYYAENWSLMFDLRILAQTALTLLGKNAY